MGDRHHLRVDLRSTGVLPAGEVGGMSAIRVEGLRKDFRQVRALDGLSFQVESGTVFGFLGPNGAGKTTTLRILAGLARPDGGAAWVANHPVGHGSPARRQVGYLPEEP